jgi:DNA-binding CsgD family transcriptional regulator
MSARELYSSIVAAVDRLLEKKYGPYADMEKVLEERFELREQVLNYLSANPLASKAFLCKGRRLVDNGLLKMLLDRGYTNRLIAAFFNVTTHTVSRHRVKVTGVRGHRIRGPIQVSSSLPPSLRTAAELYAKGLPVKEIAEKMGIGVKSVRHYIHLARHPEVYKKKFYRRKIVRIDTRPSLRFSVGTRPRKNGARLWLQDVFRRNALYGRVVYFNTIEERIDFLIKVFSGETLSGPRKHGLTRWLKEENLMSKGEVNAFYQKLLQKPPLICSVNGFEG